MRLDKYLKVSRILKRRSVSKELALHQRIEVNGRVVKPSYDVKVNDLITITYGRRVLTVKVLEVAEYTRKDAAKDLYEIVSEGFKEETDTILDQEHHI
ncbi:MAG: RNA-binding S4 domain-containing protein [Erysipelotrichaceae bacterium]|nr:RNA-binding S4 domain-containing protein [Erysipelotrichaceae bacterium]MDY5251205.1 RNA-binding S4 domain-containing protein [Erysipelotrichaceae bacterium]